MSGARNANHEHEDETMARYTITHSCGHDAQVHVAGSRSERDGELDRLAGRVCDECYKAAKRAEDAAATAKASEGLPVMSGTDKQVAWAESIRVRLLAKTNEAIDDMELLGKKKGAAALRSALALVVAEHVDARFWIDGREREHIADLVQAKYNESKKAVQ